MSPRPARAEARDTRHDILVAALDLFSQHGFAGTSMRTLARSVGVRESALYHHFPSKAALFEALVLEFGPARALTRLDEADLDAVLADGLEPFLRGFSRALMAQWASPVDQRFVRLLLAEGPRLKDAGLLHPQALIARAQEHVTRMYEALRARGLVRDLGDPLAFFFGLVPGLMAVRMLHLVLAEGEPDLDAALARVDAHVRFFVDAVRPRGEG